MTCSLWTSRCSRFNRLFSPAVFSRTKHTSASEKSPPKKRSSRSTSENGNNVGKPKHLKQVKKLTEKVKGAKSLFNPNTFEFSPSPRRYSNDDLKEVMFESKESNANGTKIFEEFFTSSKRKPLVAIVGRPNVGKSTLFNRLVGYSKSLVTPIAGTTRDRVYGTCEWQGWKFLLVDTGGLLGTTHEWSEDIHNQALGAISEADIIIYLLDWTDKIHPNDVKISRLLRKQTFLRDVRSLLSSDKQIIKEGDEQQKKIKPVIVAMNKCDNEQRIESLNELSLERLGLGPALAISAIHGIGVMELLDTLTKKFAELGFEQISDDDEEEAKDIKIAIVGKPNVGKSSLLNTILGFERSIVSPVPGTTSDPVDEYIVWKNEYPLTLIDTAGIRKKKGTEIEELSTLWAFKVIERSHVALLLIDAVEGPSNQDLRIAGFITDNWKSCVVVVNKWDLASNRPDVKQSDYESGLRSYLRFLDYVPIFFISARTGYNVDRLVELAIKVAYERRVKIATKDLFNIMQRATLLQKPPSKGKKMVKFRFVTQIRMGVPTFVFFVTHPELITDVYSKFLEGCIRRDYPFTGTPIRLIFSHNQKKTNQKNRKTKVTENI